MIAFEIREGLKGNVIHGGWGWRWWSKEKLIKVDPDDAYPGFLYGIFQ